MSGETWDDVMERTKREAVPTTERPFAARVVEGESLLPNPGDPYKAAATQSNEGLTRLTCILGKEHFKPGGQPYWFFQYVQLDSHLGFGFTGDGQEFTLRFLGFKPVLITVRGRNLLRLCDYLHLHRIAWIRQADRDFRGEGKQPVITSIQITELADGSEAEVQPRALPGREIPG